MKVILVFVVIMLSSLAQGAGLTNPGSVNDFFMSNSLSMQSYLDNKLVVRQKDDDLRGDIYEFQTKSPLKAFMFSLAVPGAGQFYTGSKIKAGSFLAADVLLWGGYLLFHGKGVDKETAYKAYANDHYISSVFRDWWGTLDTSITNRYSHRLYFDDTGSPIKSREYYENIGKYDEFQVGWDDIGTNFPPEPVQGGAGVTSPHRRAYLDMRKQSNDYFAKATTMAMVSIANHIVSAFDAAIGARKFNRGTKQYSLKFESRNIDGNATPYLVFVTKF